VKTHRAADSVDASPEKSFFIYMITRDINLEDCILDLLDNSIDGAIRTRGPEASLEGLSVRIEFNESAFSIADNCGGIPLDVARHYAFHFGRPMEAEPVGRGVGLYGVGMKRAVFKLGRKIEIVSSTATEGFRVDIDVSAWEQSPHWNFPMEQLRSPGPAGTTVRVREFNPAVAEEFRGRMFADELRQMVSRDYSMFLQRGLAVQVNRKTVPITVLQLLEGGKFKAAKLAYDDDDVHVELIAGMAAPPPESADESQGINVDPFGWFVLCNDRVVKAANKDEDTVWGVQGSTRWHNQYRGFLGIARFSSINPSLLPWTTTKRELDKTAAVYRRAVKRMKDLTDQWVRYTRRRKRAPDKARAAERAAEPKALTEVDDSDGMRFPDLPETPEIGHIQYTKPKDDILRVAAALGDPEMTFVEVGERTFDYYFEREVEP